MARSLEPAPAYDVMLTDGRIVPRVSGTDLRPWPDDGGPPLAAAPPRQVHGALRSRP